MNEFLEYADKWAATRSSFGAPMLKFREGATQFRSLDSKPTSRRVHFSSIGNQQPICPGEGCAFCERKDEITVQHYMSVVDRRDDKVKVLIFSPAALEEIADLIRKVSEKLGSTELNSPKNYDISMNRVGKDRYATRFIATQVPNTTLDASKYTAVDLNKILRPMPAEETQKYKGEKAPAPTTSSPTTTARKPKDARQPVSSSVPTVDMKNAIAEDDTVV
ncbi:hypothetical protein LCGC14_1915800 [marine sediment metagenome]|uniref:Uncharacterized protein n=1 Tax=marine sediment metagenome TaxID=412755 RepID=A0A0F9GFM2_9ZZZZ